MTSPIDPREVRSARARALLNDPLLTEVLKSVSDRAVQEWTDTQPSQVELREWAWNRVKAVEAVVNEIAVVARDNDVRNFNAKAKK